MKHLLSLIGLVLFFFNLHAQDFSRHSFALNLGGFHQVPLEHATQDIGYEFHVAKHIGGTYRLKLTERHGLRISGDHTEIYQKNEFYDYGNEVTYDEIQAGLGYEFIIKQGKFEAYVGIDAIVVRSENFAYFWTGYYGTYITTNRYGYGGSMLFGLRYNILKKLAIGLETNATQSLNRHHYKMESDYLPTNLDTVSYPSFLEFNLISALTIKFTI